MLGLRLVRTSLCSLALAGVLLAPLLSGTLFLREG